MSKITYQPPNYKGFMEHLMAWDEEGITHGMSDLIYLAKKYGTPVPIGFDEQGNAIFPKEESNEQEIQGTID